METSSDWQPVVVDLSAWRGGPVYLRWMLTGPQAVWRVMDVLLTRVP